MQKERTRAAKCSAGKEKERVLGGGGGGVRSYEALNAGLKSSCMKSKVRVVQSC